jgi:hypothetical protein
MSHRHDTFTSTLDGARAHAEWHPDEFWEPLDDRPDLADLQRQGGDLPAGVQWGDPWAAS